MLQSNKVDFYKEQQKGIEKKGGIMPSFVDDICCSKLFLKLIKKYTKEFKKPKLLDVGGGNAFRSIYLSYFFDVDVLDIDKKIVERAKYHNQFLHGKINVRCADASDVKEKYDLIYSNAVYEYFNKEKLLKALKLHLSLSKYLIFGIPLFPPKGSPDPDAYFHSLKEWKKIIKEAGGKILEIHGLQYPLRIGNIAAYNIRISRLFHPFARIITFVCKK